MAAARGHPDGAGRHDVARRLGRTRHGQVLRGGRQVPSRWNPAAGRCAPTGHTLNRGDWITIDGSSGRVIIGQVPLVAATLGEHFERFMKWADRYRRLRVRANADNPADARRARSFGDEGIGLCRTEHMFFEAERIEWIRKMILAKGRRRAAPRAGETAPDAARRLRGNLEAMDGLPVTIRLLDPPLHEFPAHEPGMIATAGRRTWASRPKRLESTIESLRETKPDARPPWLPPRHQLSRDHRDAVARHLRGGGGRREARDEAGPRGDDPAGVGLAEYRNQAEIVRQVASEVFLKARLEVSYLVGTMIELPRACLTADEIAEDAEFFSYGTNDLTQTTFGLSRDDAGRFLPMYVDHKLLPADPFQVLDQRGVGKLMTIGIELGRKTRKDLKIGICGEHGGEPSSVAFCHAAGMTYVSCSPFRIAIARLAAAQAALRERGVEDRTAATV